MGDATGSINSSLDKATGSAPTSDGINEPLRAIILLVLFSVGAVAGVMIILGGVQYSASQGDTQKVKKAKDTIMYGIIGLVVAILAFAIVEFVLRSVF